MKLITIGNDLIINKKEILLIAREERMVKIIFKNTVQFNWYMTYPSEEDAIINLNLIKKIMRIK